MQSMVLSRESISSVYALILIVIPVSPLLFATTLGLRVSHRVPVSALTPLSVQPCAARAARVVFDSHYQCLCASCNALALEQSAQQHA